MKINCQYTTAYLDGKTTQTLRAMLQREPIGSILQKVPVRLHLFFCDSPVTEAAPHFVYFEQARGCWLPVLSPVVPPGLYVSTQQSLGPAQADDDRSHVHSRGLKGIAFHAALPLSINAKSGCLDAFPAVQRGLA